MPNLCPNRAHEGIDDDTVQLHLEHRVVQRLLSRFMSQGFVHHDLSRACLAHSSDAIPRVVMLGRLSLYGKGAVRLHEELLSVTARWLEPSLRKGALAPYGREAEAKTMDLLEQSTQPGSVVRRIPEPVTQRLQAAIARDIENSCRIWKSGGPWLAVRRKPVSPSGVVWKRRGCAGFSKSKDAASPLNSASPAWNSKRPLPFTMKRNGVSLSPTGNTGSAGWTNLLREPARIQDFYAISSFRVEPVGLAYLWPVTG